jgi:hypothetical protein
VKLAKKQNQEQKKKKTKKKTKKKLKKTQMWKRKNFVKWKLSIPMLQLLH